MIGDAANLIAVGLVLAVLGYDLAVDRRLRPVTMIGGVLLLTGIFSETPAGETETWGRVGPAILAGLTIR